MSKPKV